MILYPEVSIVLPLYSRSRSRDVPFAHIQDAILAILDQSSFDFELIIINDASSQAIDEVCNKWAKRDARIRHICLSSRTKNIAEAYQLGIEHCQGQFVIFTLADDVWHSDGIVQFVQRFKSDQIYEGDVGLVYAPVAISCSLEKEENNNISLKLKNLLARKLRAFSSSYLVMVKRELLGTENDMVTQRISPFPYDFLFWIDVSKLYRIVKITTPIADSFCGLDHIKCNSFPFAKTLMSRLTVLILDKLSLLYQDEISWKVKTKTHLLKMVRYLCAKIKKTFISVLITIRCYKLVKAVYGKIKT